jgi:hypothetical protein
MSPEAILMSILCVLHIDISIIGQILIKLFRNKGQDGMGTESLQAILRAEQRKAGFRLEEDEHLIYLYDREGRRRCIFSACGTTASAIQGEVDVLMAG